MTSDKTRISDKIDHLFRHEYGKLVSVLTKTFGTSNMELAEDVVQEAMLEALKKWTYDGLPENPMGWIYKVAKYKALNVLNRERYKRDVSVDLAHHLQTNPVRDEEFDRIFTDSEIKDDQLRMIFTCCHPSLSSDSQVALTLKTLCGFSIPEIAKAFLTSEENINKRLVRARKSIKAAEVAFEVPSGKELGQRLASVLETIYLLFNEGYNATSGEKLIRYELCEEAMRLADILASNANITSSNTYALLALMTLNAARFDARIDQRGNLLDLEHQDRSNWNNDLVKKGLYYLEFAAEHNEVSIYHILAVISAHHCTAAAYSQTDWPGILSLYDMALELDKSPIILLNRAVVLSKTANAQSALEQLDHIKDHSAMQSYLPYYTTKAALHSQSGDVKTAVAVLHQALQLPLAANSKSLINNKIAEYQKNI